MTDTKRSRKLVKLLERLIKQDNLYTEEQLVEIRGNLQNVKDEIQRIEAQTFKGFGKK